MDYYYSEVHFVLACFNPSDRLETLHLLRCAAVYIVSELRGLQSQTVGFAYSTVALGHTIYANMRRPGDALYLHNFELTAGSRIKKAETSRLRFFIFQGVADQARKAL